MILNKGQKVRILFKIGTIIEGSIYSWEENNYSIKSLDEKSLFIIQDIKDIMVIKAEISQNSLEEDKILKPIQQQIEEPIISQNKQELKEDNIIVEPKFYDSLRHKKVAELRKELIKQEKELITNKLKSHYIDNTQVKPNYVNQINFLKGK